MTKILFDSRRTSDDRHGTFVEGEPENSGWPRVDSSAEVVGREASEKSKVSSPAHYTAGKVECIDAITSATAHLSGSDAYFVGNIIKYVWRFRLKNGKEDLQKARWYIDRLIEGMK